MHLPQPLVQSDETAALDLLQCYYGKGAHAHHQPFTGAWFDTWDSTGTRAQDVNRFTADDLVAVSFLSVDISAPAARVLLDIDADAFSILLEQLGPDRDLVDETERWLTTGWGGACGGSLPASPGRPHSSQQTVRTQAAAAPADLRLGRRQGHRY